MDNITGVLGKKRAKHLLRRTTFNSSKERIDLYATKTIEQILPELLTHTPKKYDMALRGANRVVMMKDQMLAPNYGGKQMDFIVTMLPAWTTGSNAGMLANWLSFLSYSVDANYKDVIYHLIPEIVMATRLDLFDNAFKGNDKIVQNYARELLELFTLGVGNYTEEDMRQVARILTGYRNTASFDKTELYTPELGWLQATRASRFHDGGDKQFSEFFNHTLIKGSTIDQERRELVDMIFSHSRIGYRIIEKLIRHYLHRDPYVDGTAVVEELVSIFKANNFDFKPVLEALFSSEYFYQDRFVVDKFASPLELVGLVQSYVGGYIQEHNKWERRGGLFDQMGQEYLNPPAIAGFRPQYEVGYDKVWIQADTLKKRHAYAEDLVDISKLGYLLDIEDFDEMIDTAAFYLYAYDADEEMKLALRNASMSNDFHWSEGRNKRIEAVTLLAKYAVKTSEFQLL